MGSAPGLRLPKTEKAALSMVDGVFSRKQGFGAAEESTQRSAYHNRDQSRRRYAQRLAVGDNSDYIRNKRMREKLGNIGTSKIWTDHEFRMLAWDGLTSRELALIMGRSLASVQQTIGRFTRAVAIARPKFRDQEVKVGSIILDSKVINFVLDEGWAGKPFRPFSTMAPVSTSEERYVPDKNRGPRPRR